MYPKSRIVPVLVDQFNDIIEWKAVNAIHNELDAPKNVDVEDLQPKYSNIFNLNRSLSTGEPIVFHGTKMKRNTSQKCFAKKLDRIHAKVIRNTINEQAEIVLDRINEKVMAEDDNEDEKFEKFENELFESEKLESEKLEDNFNEVESELKLICPTDFTEQIELKFEEKLIEFSPPKPAFNVLLEKLQNVYRHNFVVKTVVTDSRRQSGNVQCICGQPFTFSDKHLQCITCLSKCHTNCAANIPTPCIRFVDPTLKPSKMISNFVYPRSKPSIPSLIITCCRDIELKCTQSLQTQNKLNANFTMSRFKLYYVDSEQLKPVQDECKRILQQTKMGHVCMDHLSLDYLCGIVKYFLSNICEPLFTSNNWKEYSTNIRML